MRVLAAALLLCTACGSYWSHGSNTAGAIAGAAVAGAALIGAAATSAAAHRERPEEAERKEGGGFADLVPYEAVLTSCPQGRAYSRVCDHATGCRYELNGGKVFRCPDRDCTKGPPAEVIAYCGDPQ